MANMMTTELRPQRISLGAALRNTVLMYYATAIPSCTAGYLFSFANEFPDDLLATIGFLPLVSVISVLGSLGGFQATGIWGVFLLTGASIFVVGMLGYLARRKFPFLALMGLGSVIVHLNAQRVFWGIMSV